MLTALERLFVVVFDEAADTKLEAALFQSSSVPDATLEAPDESEPVLELM
ncbi:hypothetical protein [Lactococcus lactis]|uniref:ABC-type amino acid transport/signal transduction systems, periplasmic component/domain n=1 Tax=Lactococcus lactis subsp. lactis TaxID=1360 RepID=A0A0B8QPE0_LACLL|nr:hypothetical protein [Lactococcus lactis]GAM80491.1 ABC-type amino acid transport/signal transduction systems, periplasmic component/domain [Lactococcus lactis subsp. lactis]